KGHSLWLTIAPFPSAPMAAVGLHCEMPNNCFERPVRAGQHDARGEQIPRCPLAAGIRVTKQAEKPSCLGTNFTHPVPLFCCARSISPDRRIGVGSAGFVQV